MLQPENLGVAEWEKKTVKDFDCTFIIIFKSF